jgi:hypothetical protein
MLVAGLDRHARPRERGGHLPQQWTQAGDELGLGHRVGVHVTRPPQAPPRAQPPQAPPRAQPPQGAPAGLPAHAAPELGTDPGGHSAPAPVVALGMRAGQRCSQLRQLGDGQVRLPRARGVASVPHTVGALSVL